MTAFLVFYSNTPDEALRDRLPLAGSPVDLVTIDDIGDLVARTGFGVILHTEDRPAPWWADFHHLDTPEEHAEHHRVAALPEGWENMRWVEVYNGYRE